MLIDVNKSATAINPDKLLWLNQHYLKTGPVEKQEPILTEAFSKAGIDVRQGPLVRELLLVQRERCKTVSDIVEQSRYFYEGFEKFDEKAARKHLRVLVLAPLRELRDKLATLSHWNNALINSALTEVAESFGLKLSKLAQPLRVAVTGAGVSPSIADTVRLLGKERVLAGIDMALQYIEKRAST